MAERASSTARREFAAIALVSLLGLILRMVGLGQLGLSHFDEGAYASVGLWVSQSGGLAGMDPDVLSYAPPGFMVLVGGSYLVLGFKDLSAILVSELAALAMLPLVGWLGRRAFGPGAGAAAAALAALSGAHVAFSRLALTDALFLAGWVAAMAAGLRFLERPGVGRALVLGFCVGLAQNLKYNGWLSLIVVGLAVLVEWIPDGRGAPARRPVRITALLLLALGLAGLVYLPWYRFVETHGGYARLLEHHRSYVDGYQAWPANLRTQLAQVVALSGGLPWLLTGWGLAWGLCGWVRDGWNVCARRPARLVFGAALGGLSLILLPSAGWWVGLAALPWLVRRGTPGARLLAAWWVFLTAITPLYHPYARLWLPLHAAGWLILAGLAAESWGSHKSDWKAFHVNPGSWSWVWPLTVMALGVVAYWGPAPRARPLAGLLGPTAALRQGLETHLRGFLPADLTFVRVLARPQVMFYLGMDSRVPFMTYSGVDRLLQQAEPGDWVLLDEVILRQEPDPSAALGRLRGACDPVPMAQWDERLSPAVLLDVDPGAAFGDESARRSRWWLLRFRGTPGG